MRKPKRAKAMDVYGRPPADILERLNKRQVGELERYIGRVAGSVYRIAFDNGASHMISEVLLTCGRKRRTFKRKGHQDEAQGRAV